MVFRKTKISDAYVIEREQICDNRGYFTRLFCQNEYEKEALQSHFVQINVSENIRKGTLRGLHYQKEKLEDKLVACLRGRVFDVCVDIRTDSPTYGEYIAYELSEKNRRMIFIPKGCAHGYLTLEDDSQLLYLMSEFYIPGNDAGFRYDDPFFHIEWPIENDIIISDKDKSLPYFTKGI